MTRIPGKAPYYPEDCNSCRYKLYHMLDGKREYYCLKYGYAILGNKEIGGECKIKKILDGITIGAMVMAAISLIVALI